MNNTVTFTITSLLTVLLGSFHLSDDVVLVMSLGTTASVSVALAARGLWHLRRQAS